MMRNIRNADGYQILMQINKTLKNTIILRVSIQQNVAATNEIKGKKKKPDGTICALLIAFIEY